MDRKFHLDLINEGCRDDDKANLIELIHFLSKNSIRRFDGSRDLRLQHTLKRMHWVPAHGIHSRCVPRTQDSTNVEDIGHGSPTLTEK